MKLLEAKNLKIYKTLLDIFNDYTEKFPATGLDRFLNDLISFGVKAVPKDKKAQEILFYVVYGNIEPGSPAIVQDLLNRRFSDLDPKNKPYYKSGRKKEIAFWCKGGNIYDKVISLIDAKEDASKGFWCDADGKKVTLIKELTKDIQQYT